MGARPDQYAHTVISTEQNISQHSVDSRNRDTHKKSHLLNKRSAFRRKTIRWQLEKLLIRNLYGAIKSKLSKQ